MKFYTKIFTIIFLSCFTFLFISYHHETVTYIKMRALKYHTIFKILSPFTYGNEDFLIKTPGCSIPNYGIYLKIPSARKLTGVCGPRAVFIKRVGNDQVVFQIDTKIMQKYVKKKWKMECCYRFGTRVEEMDYYIYTKCTSFRNGKKVKLLQQVITVTCTARIKKDTKTVYEDSYIILKKINKKKKQNTGKSWNVLVLGMSTMSRARMYHTMPLTVQYLQRNNWLDYKGYHKVGNDNILHLISLLTDKNMTTIHQNCATKSQKCNEMFIWQKFKEAGYITAFGADYLNLPRVISKTIFEPPSTDHHVWPYFLMKYQRQMGNFFCTQNTPSGKQLLDYAFQFVDSYKTNNFFGMFWINTFSSRVESIPTLIDADIVNFLQSVNKSGALNNTFVMLLSDHGLTSGDIKTQIESYYEERLPMFFMWVPFEFQKLHTLEYQNASTNQNRPISVYDLHSTLVDIMKMSKNSKATISETCQQCAGLFREISPHGQCADAGIDNKSCACRDLQSFDSDIRVNEGLKLIVDYITEKSKGVKTIPCMTCSTLHLKSVLRRHMFIHSGNKYYVIAMQMVPGHISYEATVLDDGNELRILLPIVSISKHGRGNCAIDPNERMFCICDITVCDKDLISSLYTRI